MNWQKIKFSHRTTADKTSWPLTTTKIQSLMFPDVCFWLLTVGGSDVSAAGRSRWSPHPPRRKKSSSRVAVRLQSCGPPSNQPTNTNVYPGTNGKKKKKVSWRFHKGHKSRHQDGAENLIINTSRRWLRCPGEMICCDGINTAGRPFLLPSWFRNRLLLEVRLSGAPLHLQLYDPKINYDSPHMEQTTARVGQFVVFKTIWTSHHIQK